MLVGIMWQGPESTSMSVIPHWQSRYKYSLRAKRTTGLQHESTVVPVNAEFYPKLKESWAKFENILIFLT